MSYEKLVLISNNKTVGFCGAFKATMREFSKDEGPMSKEPLAPILAIVCSFAAGIGTWLSERSARRQTRTEFTYVAKSRTPSFI